jgi:hypothetical protein
MALTNDLEPRISGLVVISKSTKTEQDINFDDTGAILCNHILHCFFNYFVVLVF